MEIVEYDPKYREDFVRLNTEWLTKLYYIESYDQYSMDHVEELIDKGSMVYFAVDNGKVLATCMTEPLGDDVWEICKLAAEEQYTGTGAGSAVLKSGKGFGIITSQNSNQIQDLGCFGEHLIIRGTLSVPGLRPPAAFAANL